MITKIYIENFKGIGSPGVEIELKPITLLFGANSAGKSTIIQAMHYAREILANKNIDPEKIELGGNSYDFGGFKNVVNNQVLQNRIRIKIDFKFKSSWIEYFDFDFEQELDNEDPGNILRKIREETENAYVDLEIFWDYDSSKPIVNYTVGFNNERFGSIIEKKIRTGYQLLVENLNYSHSIFKDEENLLYDMDNLNIPGSILKDNVANVIRYNVYGEPGDVVFDDIEIMEQDTAIPVWGRQLIFDDNIFNKPNSKDIEKVSNELLNFKREKSIFQQIFNIIFVGFGKILADKLDSINYLGPLREIPDRNMLDAKSDKNINWSNGLKAWEILKNSDQDFIEIVNYWLDKFGTTYQIMKKESKLIDIDTDFYRKVIQEIIIDEHEIKHTFKEADSISDIYFYDFEKNVRLKSQDIGVGISQILPVVVATLNLKNLSTLIVEQPELHTHPRMQVELGDMFIEQINKEQDVRFIIETHSEHLMLRLLRRIEETTNDELPRDEIRLSKYHLSVYFFEANQDGTKVTLLPVDGSGEFTRQWPQGFFEERAEELFR